MGFLDSYCTFRSLNEELINSCIQLDCENTDLNDFFASDCIRYSHELLGKSYCFTLDENPSIIVCAFTIANDSIKTNILPKPRKNKINRLIPNSKRLNSYPAVLIGRLGVNKNFKRKGIGNELMDFIKAWFIDGTNKTGCRFLVVDSYNEHGPLNYYINNGFQYLFETEEEEKKYAGHIIELPLHTRLMQFDLIVLKEKFN